MSADLLALYDVDERFSATYPDSRREELPALVRHVDLVGTSSAVIYSRLTPESMDTAIAEQVAYFASLGHDFEWKAYAHDQPPDLAAHLAAHGFAAEETEAILVLDLQTTHPAPEAPSRVRRITRREELGDLVTVKERVYTKDVKRLVDRLTFELEHVPDAISLYVAYQNGAPAACGWIRFPTSSAFASLWGGSTVPEARGRGLYTDLLSVRVQEAIGRGFRYLTIDASSMSRPIVERRGFRVLTFATPWMWFTRAPQGG
ncbi:MAG TPA: GNAT family N-acetyltransferase [Chloroflexota bacterium]|nr:GNAT family N-acetyltransferase [Chloroflexota bacterium]